jgi:Mg2+ and Co2+ transporter CorA
VDTRRAVSFMMRGSKMLNAEHSEEARQILRDIDSLDPYTRLLFDKINFLMDATAGFYQHQPKQDHQDLWSPAWRCCRLMLIAR